MRSALTKSILLASVALLSSCDKGGSDNKTAQVPTSVRIQAQGNGSQFCDVSGSQITCYGLNSVNAQCNSGTQNFSDNVHLCQQMQTLMNSSMGSACNTASAAQTVYSQYNCNTLLSQNQGGLTPPINSGTTPDNSTLRTVECEFEAYRSGNSGFFNRQVGTGHLTGQFNFDGRLPQTFNLRSKFLGLDAGAFGVTKLIYTPSTIQGSSDTITLSNQGLNKQLQASQSGFAGQNVSLDMQSDDGSMRLTVSCTGKTGFRKNIKPKAYTQYVCRGESSLYGSKREKVQVSFPYNSTLIGSELRIAENLTATVTGDQSGADDARITFTATGVGSSVSLISNAYLKTKSVLKATDNYTNIDLTCAPE